nr:hypothetical protein nle12_1 [uncultured bacterium]
MRRPAVTVAVVILVLGTTLLALLIPYTRVDNCTAIEHNALDNNSSVASSYFAADYQSVREKVVSAGKGSGALLEHIQHPLSGPDGRPLYTDALLLGDPEADRILVLVSGTHGVEGFAGSAIQIGLLEQGYQNELPTGAYSGPS